MKELDSILVAVGRARAGAKPAALATVSGLLIRSAQMREEYNPMGSVGMWVSKLAKGFGR